jgi:hypothetical protein
MVDFCYRAAVHPKGKSMSQAMIDRRSRASVEARLVIHQRLR